MYTFWGVKINCRGSYSKDTMEFSGTLQECGEFAKKNISRLNSGYLAKDGKIEWCFYRRFQRKLIWEHWGQKKKEMNLFEQFE